MKRLALGLAAVLMTAGMGFAAEPAKVGKTPGGNVYTNLKGMTLYTFDKDKGGESACYDACAATWPPYKADAKANDSGEWTVISRKDGSKMWAYDKKPVYTYAKDKKAGDMKGEGIGGLWHVAKAD